MMTNKEIRECENEIIAVINRYNFPFELNRIMLTNLARQCEHEADKAIMSEAREPIEEKGEL